MIEYIFGTITAITNCKVMTCPVSILNGGELHVYAHMPKTHPLIKDRDWCRPSHVTFVSFPSSFSLTTRSALNNSSYGSPADGQRRIVAPTRIVHRRCNKTKQNGNRSRKSKTNLFTILFKQKVLLCSLASSRRGDGSSAGDLGRILHDCVARSCSGNLCCRWRR